MTVLHILGLAALVPSLVLGQGMDNNFFANNNFGTPQANNNFGTPQANNNFGTPQANNAGANTGTATPTSNLQLPGTQTSNFGQPQTPGTQMSNFGQPQTPGTPSNTNFVQPPMTVNSNMPNSNQIAGARLPVSGNGNIKSPITQVGPNNGNLGAANQPVPTPFNAPANTNPQPRAQAPPTMPMQQSRPQLSNMAPQGSVSPDQNFLNQGTPMNQMNGGRQMFSSFDPNNPTPFQSGQRTNQQFRPNQPPPGNGFDFNRFGTPGFDQMTFRDQGLGTGQVDAVQFGVGPNDQPFRVDFGPQRPQTPFNSGFGPLPGLGGPAGGDPMGPIMGGFPGDMGGQQMPPFGAAMPGMPNMPGALPGAMPGMFGGGSGFFGGGDSMFGGGNSMFGGGSMFGMPPQPQSQGLFDSIGGFFTRVFGG